LAVSTFPRGENSYVESRSQRPARLSDPGEGHSAGLGPDRALDQCRGDDPDDHVGMADLQRLAAVRFQVFPLDHARRLARRLGFAGGRFRKKLLPITPGGVISDARAALTGKLSHDDLTRYNYVQKLLYAGIIVVGIVIVLSGLSIWKPVQLQYLTALFGGYDVARYVHFFCMAAICGFLIVHVALALLVPKSLRAMITGR
jgi:hypothetical protein